MAKKIRINLSVTSEDQEVIARTTEHFVRAASGLALDGTEAFIMIGPDTEDEQSE
jgi:hypothetical protein